MCGIVGLISFDNHKVDEKLVWAMNRTLTHRGPDSEGYCIEGPVGIGMRRLKVIDLETGDQPIHFYERGLSIVFNGEIYNYKELRKSLSALGHVFKTDSDTEVLLKTYAEYGEDCLKHLNGMFAFCIYDRASHKLFIARDRLGIKPLFYLHESKRFAFASEIKAFFKLDKFEPEVREESLGHFLSMNYLPAPHTPLKNVEQLPPAHYMIVEKSGEKKVVEYWKIPSENTGGNDSETSTLKKIDQLIHRSIERRINADVPVGVFLSGGLDSSLILAYAKEHTDRKIKTFSVGFEDSRYDESSFALSASSYYGTDHQMILCTPQDVTNYAKDIAWHADNWLADQAALPQYVLSKHTREDVTVALSGDGGDELFIGYPTFKADTAFQRYSRIPGFIREGLIKPLISAFPSTTGKLSADYIAKKFVNAGGLSLEDAHAYWRTIFSRDEQKTILLPSVFKQIQHLKQSEIYYRYSQDYSGSVLAKLAHADMKTWLAGNILSKVDSMSMAHGLEARVPFLDHELVEYVASLPVDMRFFKNKLKFLLKKVARGKVPSGIIDRKKAGFHFPLAEWMKKDLKPMFTQSFAALPSEMVRYFDEDSVRKVFEQHCSGKNNQAFKVWGLFILRHWFENYGRGFHHHPMKMNERDSVML